jgi:hypothetical protein
MENVAVKHFIESCLAPVEERPTARELLDHELLIDLAEPLADQDPAPQGGVFTPLSGPVPAAAHMTAMPSIEAAAAGSFQTEQRVHLAEAAAAQARQGGPGVPENRETGAAEIGVQPRTGGSLDDTGSTGTFVEIKIVDAKIASLATDGVGVIIAINAAIDGLVPPPPPSTPTLESHTGEWPLFVLVSLLALLSFPRSFPSSSASPTLSCAARLSLFLSLARWGV